MRRRGPNGMRPLELLAEMPGSGLELLRHHLQCRMLSRGPNGMRPLEILAEMPGEGLEHNSHHLQCHYKLMLRRGPNGMKPLELRADMQVKDWSQAIITYSTTINYAKKGSQWYEAPGASSRDARFRIGAETSSRHHFMLP